MAVKKTKLTKNHKIAVAMIVVIAVLFVAYNFLMRSQMKSGFEISCRTGDIIKINIARPPPLCIACVEVCSGSVAVSVNGTKICEGVGRASDAGTPESVVVPCLGIESYRGSEVLVTSSVNSSYGLFSKQDVVVKIE